MTGQPAGRDILKFFYARFWTFLHTNYWNYPGYNCSKYIFSLCSLCISEHVWEAVLVQYCDVWWKKFGRKWISLVEEKVKDLCQTCVWQLNLKWSCNYYIFCINNYNTPVIFCMISGPLSLRESSVTWLHWQHKEYLPSIWSALNSI